LNWHREILKMRHFLRKGAETLPEHSRD